MATIPTTDCSFGDIVTAYNTTVAPSSQISMSNINLKTSFSGKTVYNPGWPITGATVIPSSSISTSLFYGKTFQIPVPTVTFSSPVVVDAYAGALAGTQGIPGTWVNPTITIDARYSNPILYALYIGPGSAYGSGSGGVTPGEFLTVRSSANLNSSWSPAGGSTENINWPYGFDIAFTPPLPVRTFSITTGFFGVYVAYGSLVGYAPGLYFKQTDNDEWTTPNTGPYQLIQPGSGSLPLISEVSIAVQTLTPYNDDWIYIAYQQYTANGEIYFLRFPRVDSSTGPGLHSATTISQAASVGSMASTPRVAVPKESSAQQTSTHVFIVWLEMDIAQNLNVQFRKSTNGGPSFGSISQLATNADTQSTMLNLYAKDNNNLYLSYINSSQEIVLGKSTNGGANWNWTTINNLGNSVCTNGDMHVSGSKIWISFHYGTLLKNLGCAYSPDDGSTWYQNTCTTCLVDARSNAITVHNNKAYIIGGATDNSTNDRKLQCVTVQIT